VSFAVSREFVREKSSRATASTASQSWYFSLLLSFLQERGFSRLIGSSSPNLSFLYPLPIRKRPKLAAIFSSTPRR
jgi:hypothetical protein